jgi:diguanylate cyclase (GGDEF)-like protein/PAS domain S-box-containing protein
MITRMTGRANSRLFRTVDTSHQDSGDLMNTGHSEQERLDELHQTLLLDSVPEESFDSFTRLAAHLLKTPIAQVNLVASDRHFTKSSAGTTDVSAFGRTSPLEYSVCRMVVESGEPLNIPDTLSDPRTSDNPIVSRIQLHAYLGIPIKTSKGFTLGTLCVVDHQAREWTVSEEALLADLAHALSSQIDVRMEISRTNSRFQALVENSYDITTLIDQHGVITYQSPSIEHILGYVNGETLGAYCLDLVHPDDLPSVSDDFGRLLASSGTNVVAEYRIRNRDGWWVWVESTGRNLLEDPEIGSVLVNTRDVTERKELEQFLTYQAHHDPLTGIGNRQLLLDHLEGVFSDVTPADTPVTLLILDLTRFKTINDLFGHMEGDRVLKQVARRITDATLDARCVARLGGDEFAILYTSHPCDQAESLARRLSNDLNDLPVTGGQSIPVTCRIGVASQCRSESSVEELLQCADLALLSAKQSSTEKIAIYQSDIRETVLERIQIEADLRGIIDRGELTVYFQPIISLETGLITGAEALARWRHPTRGLIPPDEFIPLAEESGLIRAIGTEVLRQTCTEIHHWDSVNQNHFAMKVGINLSATELTDPELLSTMRGTLEECNIDPSRIVLEITESTVIIRSDLVRQRLADLRSLGIVLAVDDFGTGYSSLAYLTRLPFDILKIDRAFIQDLGNVPTNRQILATIVNLAEHLGLDVVAEGVESAEQLAMIQSLNFAFLQGYFIAQPMPAEQFRAFYAENSARALITPSSDL